MNFGLYRVYRYIMAQVKSYKLTGAIVNPIE